tara:strand:- start:2748 stop:3170 length:423 start_codon:yes stop_codon:yes gene_type:complete
VNLFINSSSISPEDADTVSTTLTVDLLAPAIALANGSAESTALRVHGTMIVFGGWGGSPFSVAWCGLTMSRGTEVVRHKLSSKPVEKNRCVRDRVVVAIATIPNELVADRDEIIEAGSPVAMPHRDFTPCGPSRLTTSSR